jgi:mono/diheme cytochrome c family protein
VVDDFKGLGRDMLRPVLAGAALCIVVFMAGCSEDSLSASAATVASRDDGSVSASPQPRERVSSLQGAVQSGARSGAGAEDTAARLIAHPENIQLGLSIARSQLTLRNPREHDPKALGEGKDLFVSYNCADCHGDEGSGAMGPALDDGRWHFGGNAGEVYESISEGRPDGMPAWGGRIPDSQIWALVKYVRSLSAGKDPTTENFEGATIQRTGH